MSTFYPDEASLNNVIANSSAADIIYLPNITITSQVVIGVNCTVIGQENSVIDLRGKGIQNALVITASDPDVSNIKIFNDDTDNYTGVYISNSAANLTQIQSTSNIGFKIESCNQAEFDYLSSENSITGFDIRDSLNCKFTNCEASKSTIGWNIEGSSSIIGDIYAYQEFGLNVSGNDDSGLTASTTYYITINGIEYSITTGNTPISYNNIVNLLNNNNDFKSNYSASLTNGDIRISRIFSGNINITIPSTTSPDLISSINGFVNLDPAVSSTNEADRNDRAHNNSFNKCAAQENNIGVRLVNADHNSWEESIIMNSTNIGLYQIVNSYTNSFRGEIYGNAFYGAKNTDRAGNLHDLDLRECWWGNISGPSGEGPGSGDKITGYINFEPWLRSGSEPDLSYPETRNWIWSMLGSPLVRVELTEEQITQDIEIAIEKFMYYWTPEPHYIYFDVNAGQQEIMLPIHVPKESIIEVTYQPSADIFSQLSGSGTSFFLTYYLQKTGGTFLADFYIAMSYKEDFERVLGIIPSYEFLTHPENKSLPYDKVNNPYRDFIRVYPKPDINSIKLAVKVNRALTEEEVDQRVWIRKYALTWAKQQLAQIRGKFASIPGPTGEIQLNASELMTEAQQEREFLLKDLISRGEPLGFSTG